MSITLDNSLCQSDNFYPSIEYIPIISTAYAIKAVYDKSIHLPSLSSDLIEKSRYYTHLQSTSYSRQLTLMIPILGNLTIYLYDVIAKSSLQEKCSLKNKGCAQANIASDAKIAKELNAAFILALKNHQAQKIEELIRSGADATTSLSYFWTERDCDWILESSALIYSVRHNRHEMVKVLCRHYCSKELSSALEIALRQGFCNVAQEIIKGGADINYVNSFEETPLIIAARTCNQETVQALLKAGANVNYIGKDGLTALMHAISDRNLETTATLLEAGANVNHTDNSGKTALMLAVEKSNLKIVETLLQTPSLQKGSFLGFGTKPVNYADQDGNTALIIAIKNVRYSYRNQREYNMCMNTQNIVKALLALPGIDTFHANKQGETANSLLEKLDKEMKSSQYY